MAKDPTLNPQPSEAGLRRRHLLRGGAALAGAVGLTAMAASVAPTAEAADGDSVVLGEQNEASSTTTVAIAAGSAPVVTLTNANGPALSLTPLDASWNGELAVGEIANTELGPYIGVDATGNPEVTVLATGLDLDLLPLPISISPERALDTRFDGGRVAIIRRSSPTALDSSGRLRGGSWIDVRIFAVGGSVEVSSYFLNVTAVGSLAAGYVTAYPPGFRPTASTLNYSKGQTIANAAFVGTVDVSGYYSVRFHASATTHLIVDVNGIVAGLTGIVDEGAAQRKSGNVRRRVTRRPTPKLGRVGR